MNDRPATVATGGERAVWRPLLRLAWRDALRRKGRTALVVALIALPVGLLFLASVAVHSSNLSERQRQLLGLGATADAVINVQSDIDGVRPSDVPAGFQKAEVRYLNAGRVKLGDAYRFVQLGQGDLAHPLLRGAVAITSGAAPTTAGSAAVSTDIARRWGVGVGDTIEVRRGGIPLRVTGVFELADDVGGDLVVVPTPLTGFEAVTARVWVKAPSADALYDWLGTTTEFRSFVTRAGAVPGPSVASDRFMPVVVLYTLGTVGLFLVGVVVSAAFAVSARRQLRTLGLVTANGASPAVLSRLMAAHGVVTGVAGTLAGFVLGGVGLAVLAPHLNRIINLRLPGLQFRPFDLAAITVMGVVTASLAAWIPGRSVTRVPTLTALGGRRPVEPVRAGVPVFGVVLFAAGLVLLGASVTDVHTPLGQWARISGSAAGLILGGVLCTPWLIGHLEGAARRWKGARRLAARSLARQRARSGPIAAAVLVTIGAATTAAAFNESDRVQTSRERDALAPRTVSVSSYSFDGNGGTVTVPDRATVERVRAIVRAEPVEVTTLDAGGGISVVDSEGRGLTPNLVSIDAAGLRTLGADATAAAALAAGRVVVLEPLPLDGGNLVLWRDVFDPRDAAEPTLTTRTQLSVPAVTTSNLITLEDTWQLDDGNCPPPECRNTIPTVVLSPTLAERYGFRASSTSVLLRSPQALSVSQVGELRELRAVLNEESIEAAERGSDIASGLAFTDTSDPTSRVLQLILGGIVVLLALGVTGIGLALTAAENRADDATLLALGAPPRFRRRIRAWEALFLAGTGGVLGVVLGFLVGAVAIGNGSDKAIAFPWLTGLGLSVVLPLLAAALFGLFARTPRIVLLRED